MNLRRCAGAVLAMGMVACAAPAVASFATPTVCKGSMVFADDDGSPVTYRLRLEFGGDRYRILATDLETGETTDDRGSCGSYLGGGCKHVVSAEDGSYLFRLAPAEGGRYRDDETWDDGSAATALLECAPGA